jgi:hypothetical protein
MQIEFIKTYIIYRIKSLILILKLKELKITLFNINIL